MEELGAHWSVKNTETMTTKYVRSFLAHTTLSTVAKETFNIISTTIHSSHHHTTDNDCCSIKFSWLVYLVKVLILLAMLSHTELAIQDLSTFATYKQS